MKITRITKVILEKPKKYYDVINANPYNNFLVKTNKGYICSHNCFFDEISFIKNSDIERQKQIAMDMIDTAIGGMKTRFLDKGKNPTLLILASSKRTEKSFLEEHMKKKLEDEGEFEKTLIVDEPVWNIKPSSTYSGIRFNVALGNKFLQSEIIPDGVDVNIYRNRGFKILDVPIEFKADFKDDIDRALCDFAGISSSELTKYINGPRLYKVKHSEFKNPFIKDVLEIGNDSADTNQYYDFFDMTRVDRNMLQYPLFIHLDMSINGDKTGIVGTWIIGKKPGINNDVGELLYRLSFNVSIKAPKGHQISFAKNREFIYWLKEQGFAIKGITTDTYQNAALAQDFIAKGFNYEVLSVDRVNRDHICEPYAYLKNAIYEERVQIYEDCPLLTEELLGLERNNNTGRIDHPDSGRYGSKDAADAFAGSIFNASKHGEEFDFEFGETIDAIVDVSSESSSGDYRTQATVDFEEELKKVASSFGMAAPANQSGFIDFGLGAATSDYSWMDDGIII